MQSEFKQKCVPYLPRERALQGARLWRGGVLRDSMLVTGHPQHSMLIMDASRPFDLAIGDSTSDFFWVRITCPSFISSISRSKEATNCHGVLQI
jgi:hypothetical protein